MKNIDELVSYYMKDVYKIVDQKFNFIKNKKDIYDIAMEKLYYLILRYYNEDYTESEFKCNILNNYLYKLVLYAAIKNIDIFQLYSDKVALINFVEEKIKSEKCLDLIKWTKLNSKYLENQIIYDGEYNSFSKIEFDDEVRYILSFLNDDRASEIVYRHIILEETYEEIGKRFNLSKQTVFNIFNKSIDILRNVFANKKIKKNNLLKGLAQSINMTYTSLCKLLDIIPSSMEDNMNEYIKYSDKLLHNLCEYFNLSEDEILMLRKICYSGLYSDGEVLELIKGYTKNHDDRYNNIVFDEFEKRKSYSLVK